MTAGSGIYRIALPVNASIPLGTEVSGSVWLYDSSTGNGWLAFANIFASYIEIIYGSGGTGFTTTNTGPWTWAASDTITGTLTYEEA